jgi:hypothetical protein
MTLKVPISLKQLATFFASKVSNLAVTYWVSLKFKFRIEWFFTIRTLEVLFGLVNKLMITKTAFCFEVLVTVVAFIDWNFHMISNMISNFSLFRKKFSTRIALKWSLSWSFACGWPLESIKKNKNLLIGCSDRTKFSENLLIWIQNNFLFDLDLIHDLLFLQRFQ